MNEYLNNPQKCPNCGELLEFCGSKGENHNMERIEYQCRRCLCWWTLNKHSMTDEEIRELASS